MTTHTSAAAMSAVRIMDFSGVAATTPLDQVTGTSNTSTSAASGAVPAAAGELVVGMIAGHGSTQLITVTTPGLTALAQQTSASPVASVVGGYLVAATANSVTMTGTFSSAMYWAAGVATFRPS